MENLYVFKIRHVIYFMLNVQMIKKIYHPQYTEIISVMWLYKQGNEYCTQLFIFFSVYFIAYISHFTPQCINIGILERFLLIWKSLYRLVSIQSTYCSNWPRLFFRHSMALELDDGGKSTSSLPNACFKPGKHLITCFF